MEKRSQEYHITAGRVPLSDIDLGQVIYHGNYFRFYNHARDEFLRDLGFSYKKLMNNGFHLTVVELACKYRRPVFYDDKIEIYTGITWVRSRSLGVIQKLYQVKPEGLALCNECSLSLVCVTFDGKPARLPDDLKTKFGAVLLQE